MEFRRVRSEEHTSELQSRRDLVCRLLLEKKKDVCSRSEEHTSELQSRRDIVCRLLLDKRSPIVTLEVGRRGSRSFPLNTSPPSIVSPCSTVTVFFKAVAAHRQRRSSPTRHFSD